MQMYVHYYERELINEGDNPLIGIVLCADKSESVVKYTLPENETQIFASKCKLYLPSEEELLRELNQEYQALEAGKTDEENSGDMKLIFCGKRVARTVFVQQKYFSYFRFSAFFSRAGNVTSFPETSFSNFASRISFSMHIFPSMESVDCSLQ